MHITGDAAFLHIPCGYVKHVKRIYGAAVIDFRNARLVSVQ